MLKLIKYGVLFLVFIFGQTGWAQNDSTEIWNKFQSALQEKDADQAIIELQNVSALSNENDLTHLVLSVLNTLTM